MIPIPAYLRPNAAFLKGSKERIRFSCYCDCGGTTFCLSENCLTTEEKAVMKPYEEALMEACTGCWATMMTVGPDGTRHHWKLYTPLGLAGPKKEIFLPEAPFFAGIQVIKAVCAHCGKEYLLFDSRVHGYDGVTEEKPPEVMAYRPHFRKKTRSPAAVEIQVENDPSLAEFRENTRLDFDEAQYSNAFGWIAIYAVSPDGRRRKLFEAETA